MPTGVYKRSKEQLEQIRDLAKNRKGKPLSQETRDKIKLHYNPNSLKALLQFNEFRKDKSLEKLFGLEKAKKLKQVWREKKLGKIATLDTRKKMSDSRKGKHINQNPKCYFKKGKENPNWMNDRTNDKEYKKKYQRKYMKKRRRKDPKFHLDNNISNLIRCSLKVKKAKKAGRKWETLVGYSLEDLIKHLEKQFDSKMNWENYGSYWSIDHIKPRSLFHYIYPEDPQFKECWALNNLQPLEKIENIIKSNRY